MKNRIWTLFIALTFLTACTYEKDRFDEVVTTHSEEHFNFYRHLDIAPKPTTRGQNVVEYRVTMEQLFDKESKLDKNAPLDNYAIVAINNHNQPPFVEFFQPQSPLPIFSLPINSDNSVVCYTEGCMERIKVVCSLRFDTIFPIIKKNNYEIFVVTLDHNKHEDSWQIIELSMITNSRSEDAIQPAISHDGDSIAFVVDNRHNSQALYIIDSRNECSKLVASGGAMPKFMPDGRLFFVRSYASGRRDFSIYLPETGSEVAPTDEEIAMVVAVTPFSKLKEQYMMLDFLRNNLELKELHRELTVTDILNYAVRNSPRILERYYNYLAVQSRSTQNLYDIGPDLFMGVDYLATSAMLTPQDSSFSAIGDRIGEDNFMRLMSGLSIPVIPNLPLRWATRYRFEWEVEEAKTLLMQELNKTLGEVMLAIFDYGEKRGSMEHLKYQIAINERRLKRYQAAAQIDEIHLERITFAENIDHGLRSELNFLAESLLTAQTKIAALLGMNDGKALLIKMPENLQNYLDPPEKLLRKPEFFMAQAWLNRQELRAIETRIAQTAATRDMGPENMRIDAVRISVGYGLGIMQWQEFVDDFLLLGMAYTRPLRLPIVTQSYYDDYSARIMALRMDKYALRGEISVAVQEAWQDLHTAMGKSLHRAKRATFFQEQSRLSELHQSYGDEFFDTPASSVEDMDAILNLLQENLTTFQHRFESWKRLIKLYSVAGRSDLLVPELIEVFSPHEVKFNPQASEPKHGEHRSLYLWKSLKVVGDREQRQAFLDLCKKHNINLVYCYLSMKRGEEPFLTQYRPEFQYFLECCRRQKISVIALMGELDWLNPALRQDCKTLVDNLNAFNRDQKAHGRVGFLGLKLDVEPHGLPNWQQDRPTLIKQYLELLEEVGAMIGKESLFVDVSYHYNFMPYRSGEDFLKAISRRVRGFTVMAYLNRYSKIYEKMRPILERKELNCQIEMAIETHRISEKGISFFGFPLADVMEILAQAEQEFGNYPNFSGIAIHDYTGFREMK